LEEALENGKSEGLILYYCRYRGYPSLSDDRFLGKISVKNFNTLLASIEGHQEVVDFTELSSEKQQDLLFALLGKRGIDSHLAIFRNEFLALETEESGGLITWGKRVNLNRESRFRPQNSPLSFEQRFRGNVSVESFNRMLRTFAVFNQKTKKMTKKMGNEVIGNIERGIIHLSKAQHLSKNNETNHYLDRAKDYLKLALQEETAE
jgi:hypothetical protein